MTSRLGAIVALSVTAVACGDDGPAAEAPDAGFPDGTVATGDGPVRGHLDGDVWAYLGIPYAAPPLGDLRFRAPAAVEPWDDVLDADAFGPRCPQLEDGAFVGDEDCLVLNVWSPELADARPVMVWLHGGGNSVGTASDPLYDGAALAAAGNVVVVSLNYRLGQLGFLAHDAIGDGNWGLLDQVAALRWVADNAAAFGGDPDKVTIFGESAGGRDVCTLLATPSAAGLFERAIIQSGACKFLATLAAAKTQGDEVAAVLGCDDAACLRAASAEDVVDALPADVSALASGSYGPNVDGDVLPEQAEDAIVAGRGNEVPLLVGANADETSSAAPLSMTQPQYEALIRGTFGTTFGDQVLAEYAAVSPPRAAYVRVTSDYRFICPSREIARSATTGWSAPARRYFFQYAPSVLGAVHGIEIPYLFASFDAVLVNGQPYVATATDLAISAAIQERWTDFAKGIYASDWPAWFDAEDPALVFDDEIYVIDAPGTSHCDFWRPLYEAL